MAASVSAASMAGIVASQPCRGTPMNGPQTSFPEPKGSGNRMRSQELNRMANRVAAAQGRIFAPEIAASIATPGAAWRRGPRGPSGVSPTSPPRKAATSARRPAAPPREDEPAASPMPKYRTPSPINWPSRCRLASTTAGRRDFARSQNTGIAGKVSCQNATIQGGPEQNADGSASPSICQRVLTATKRR